MQRRSFLASIPLILAAPFTFPWKSFAGSIKAETVQMLRVVRHSCEKCREGISPIGGFGMHHYRPSLERIMRPRSTALEGLIPDENNRLGVEVFLDWEEPEALYGLSE